MKKNKIYKYLGFCPKKNISIPKFNLKLKEIRNLIIKFRNLIIIFEFLETIRYFTRYVIKLAEKIKSETNPNNNK